MSGCLLVALPAFLANCYDSQWGQAKQSQRSVAQHMTPQALQPTLSRPTESRTEGEEARHAPSPSAARVMKLRVFATPRYGAVNLDWQRRFARTLEEANRILVPTLGVRVEILEARPWGPSQSEDDLEALLKELRGVDAGDDVDWVVGLAAAGPRLELSFHQLGFADSVGKHIMLRALSNAAEYQAIQSAFTELDEQERTNLYQARLQHKATTVFLHEFGHTLGAIHEREASSIMNPHYDTKAVTFSAETVELMRLTMQYRKPGERWKSDESWARSFLDALQNAHATWMPADRDEMIARLQKILATPSPTHVATASSAASSNRPAPHLGTDAGDALPATAGLETLTTSDRGRYDEAMKEQQAGRPREAWLKAEPLFSTDPAVQAVQDLRCKLALQQGMGWQQARAECSGLMQLTPGLRSPSRAR